MARRKKGSAAIDAIRRRIASETHRAGATAKVGTFLTAGLHEDASVPRSRGGAAQNVAGKVVGAGGLAKAAARRKTRRYK